MGKQKNFELIRHYHICMNRATLREELLHHGVFGNPRKTQQRFLQTVGAWAPLLYHTAWMKKSSIGDISKRISWVISDYPPNPPLCKVCEKNPCSWDSQRFSAWCSVACKNRDPDVRASIGSKNHDNAKSRNAKRANTLRNIGKTSPFQGHEHTELSKRKISETTSRSLAKSRLDFYTEYPDDIHPSDRACWTSKGEQDIVDWLRKLGYTVKHKDHKLLDGKETDIYLPSEHFAIEFDGVWWHREDPKLSDKQQVAASKDVMLIRIFEDEWQDKQDIVKSIILSKLGKFDQRYYARKLEKTEISGSEARKFMGANHLQGSRPAARHIALVDGSDIISAASISSKNELARYASKIGTQVVGGMQRLLSQEQDVFTYADRRYSPAADKTAYSRMGQFLGSTKPGYFWVKHNKRFPRWLFQKHKLEKTLGHPVDLAKTEDQIMREHGYYKLYDCGHWKFLLNPNL